MSGSVIADNQSIKIVPLAYSNVINLASGADTQNVYGTGLDEYAIIDYISADQTPANAQLQIYDLDLSVVVKILATSVDYTFNGVDEGLNGTNKVFKLPPRTQIRLTKVGGAANAVSCQIRGTIFRNSP